MYFKKQSLKKSIIFTSMAVLFVSQMLFTSCTKATKPSETFDSYKTNWEKKDFKSMYNLLSTEVKGKITQDSFVKRYDDIYKEIKAENIKIKSSNMDSLKPDTNKKILIPFSVVMDTKAGKVEVPGYKMMLKQEKVDKKNEWKVEWEDKLIFPDLGPKDKVIAKTVMPKRGEINDNKGQALAIDGKLKTVGIVPSEFNPVKDTALPQIAEILDISQDRILNLLKASTNPDWFVPIVKLPADEKDKSTKLNAIAGVKFMEAAGRVYPGGEAFGNLIGYIDSILEDEMKKHKDEGYSAQDKIGKMGLEQVYEKRLKGEKGGEIYIAKDGKDAANKIIVRKEAKDGENIKLSIDFAVQKKIYEVMNGDAGASSAINPKTGEILALVSSPSFDPNLYSTYKPDAIIKKWKDEGDKAFTNRFKAVYSPGSTFKLVTGAIGLKTGVINPDEALNITGTQWQQGNVKVKRVEDIGKPVNLLDAYIHSDNVYFAKQALKIGKENFTKEAKNFGIGDTLPIDYPILKSQISNNGLSSEQLIADTGFGQGEVLLSPLNLSLIYSSLANNGDIMTPVLELKGDVTPKVWKEKAIASANVKILIDDLVQVVENPKGTGHTDAVSKIRLLGKTGTAELKKNQNDDAEENGWFVAMDVENPRLVISMMIENVKKRGESHYVVPLVKKIFDDVLK